MHLIKRLLFSYWFFVIAGIMLMIFLSFATKKSSLDVYTPGHSTYTVNKVPEQETYETKPYHHSNIHFSMDIPSDWEYVLKDGYDTYVHAPSASSMQLQVINYYPQVNNTSYESLSETYQSRGYRLTAYERTGNNAYYLIYQSQGMSGITDYIEEVLWDHDHVVKVIFTLNDIYYEKLQNEIWHCIDSITWDYENPIQEDLYLIYQSQGDFEFAIPAHWIISGSDQAFFAYDEETSSSMTVNLLEDTTSINDISQLDYIDFLSSHRPDFSLLSFSHTENHIYGEATYLNNGILTSLIQYYYANGVYHYIITYECPTDYGEYMVPLFRGAIDSVKIFYAPEPVLDTTLSLSENNSNDLQADSFDFYKARIQENHQLMETNENTEASSFAEALMIVCNITLEKAEAIANIWNNIGLPIPVYADLFSETDFSKVIQLTIDNGTYFYLFISSDGSLQDLKQNTPEGSSIIY